MPHTDPPRPTTFTRADLHRLLHALYPLPLRQRYRLTDAAVGQAQGRWLEGSRSAAEGALWHVLARGRLTVVHGQLVVTLGTRACEVAPDGSVLAVWIQGSGKLRRLAHQARRDHRERVRGDWAP